MSSYGVQERSVEGQMILDCEKTDEMIVVNAYFWKSEEHRVTYKSGRSFLQENISSGEGAIGKT